MARKILLADDSVTAQNMGRKILADAGYEVIAVNNGSAALKKIAELKPDLVILDVYMPGYSGLEVCQRLKESQETSRIPVLLSVGKLEPFKPEEAQRVRADGYIVKPFEASELLSALSKLEDKVVPRAEPSKPGRFARAIAAAEESSRASGKEAAGDKNGWKSRIGFPHEKTEPEARVSDDSAIYNPMNRDLRTVVETAGEKAAEKAANQATDQAAIQEEKRHSSEADAKTSLDVAALAPAGLPKDVTPEEVAAIAAAAAQIHMATAAGKDEHPASDSQIVDRVEGNAPSLADTSSSLSSSVSRFLSSPLSNPLSNQEEKTEAVAETKIESVAGVASDGTPQEPQDEPVTMAATAESVVASAPATRWTAVSVALEGDDASMSLEQEMQKAHAAFMASATNPAAATLPEAPAPPAENSSASAESPTETPVAAISHPEPEPEPIREPETVVVEAVAAAAEPQAEPTTVAPSGAPSSYETSLPAPAAVEVAAHESSTEIAAAPLVALSENEPTPVEFMSPVSEAEVAGLAGLVGLGAETQLAPEAETARAEAATADGQTFAPIVPPAEPVAEDAAQPRPDPEIVKSAAAAWASWRQIRDTTPSIEATPAQSKEFELPQDVSQHVPQEVAQSIPSETAARAVAAGAEQSLQVAVSPTHGENPADVASIVDSVLADLRPKLMAEISRKMAEKK